MLHKDIGRCVLDKIYNVIILECNHKIHQFGKLDWHCFTIL